MREIKFKVWDSEKKRMSKPFNIGDYVVVWSDGDMDMPIQFTSAKKERFSFLQFTGLNDKNGKEIYEGDIVVDSGYPYFDEGERNYVSTIEWIFNGWQQVLHCVNPAKRGISDGINEQIEDEGDTGFEIIGNIHETPELLNK